MDLAKQVLVDNVLYTPFVVLPFFYCCKAVIQGTDDDRRPLEIAASALEQYRQNFAIDNGMSASIWLWADVLVFAVPLWMRMPVCQVISFSFTMLLSCMRGGEDSDASAILERMPMRASITNGIEWLQQVELRVAAPTDDALSGAWN